MLLESAAKNSIGLVKPQSADITQPLKLACGVVLPSHQLIFETYGELNAERSNAICLLYTSPSPRDVEESRMPSSA